MKRVIDIPEEFYNACVEWKDNSVATVEQAIIAVSTPYVASDEYTKGYEDAIRDVELGFIDINN